MSKREDIVAAAVVDGSSGPTLGLQEILEEDYKTWRAIWERFDGTAKTPLCEAGEGHAPWASDLPEIIMASDIFEVSKTHWLGQ